MPSRGLSPMRGGDGDVNPIKSDLELQALLKRLDKIKKYKSFQKWKSKFLDKLETYLYESGIDPATKACEKFDSMLKGFVKKTAKVIDHIEKGDLGPNKKSVKASLALNEMCNSLQNVNNDIEKIIPAGAKEEKQRKHTKFHLGAVLIREGFPQYVTMQQIEDAVTAIGEKLGDVADKQQHDMFAAYRKQVKRFCDIMSDLELYEIMMKCLEFQDPPDVEESSSVEEPITIPIKIEAPGGRILKIQVDPAETIDNIKNAIQNDCGIAPEKQILRYNGDELTEGAKSLEGYGIPAGSTLTVEPEKIPIIVNTHDGKRIELKVDPNAYISDIKRQLVDPSGIPAMNQKLFFNEDELKDLSKTAADYGIKAGSELDLEPKSIKINVQDPNGNTHKIEVSVKDPLEKIQQKIANVTKLEVPRQVVKHEGTPLKDPKATVKDMGLADGSTLTVETYKLPITVNTMDGKKIQIEVEPTDKLKDIKKQLETESGIPAKNQKLFFNGNELDDDKKTAKDYGIEEGSELDLEPKTMSINVTTPDGKTVKVEVSPQDSGATVKDKIAKKTGLAVPRQIVKFEGKEFAPDDTVKGMGIQDGSTVNVELHKVPITVETHDGKKLQIDVEPCDTIGTIKDMIANDCGIPPKKQVLKHKGQPLKENDKSLEDYGIPPGSTLTVQPDKIPIIVNTMDGKQIKVDVDPVSKLGDIKKQLEKDSGVPADNQRLFFNGNELGDDGKSVEDYGIKEGSELDLEPKTMSINVTTPDGKTHKVDITPKDTADKIKEKIKAKSGMDVPRQVLKYNGQELKSPTDTVKDIGIKDGDTLSVDAFKIPITVNTMDGKKIKVMVEPCDKISTIKKQVEKDAGVPAKNQNLFFKGKPLDDDNKQAKDYGIKAGSELDLEPKSMTIEVEDHDGKTHQIDVAPSDTTKQIKEKIKVKTGMDIPRQVVKFNGKELKDPNDTVKKLGIKDGDKLTVEPFKIPIKVNTMDGKKLSVMVEPCDTLGDIKKQLEKDSGIPGKNQRLYLDGKELKDDNKTANDYGIKKGSVLDMEPKEFAINVEAPDGKTYSLKVDPQDSGDTLKNKISRETGIAIPRQVLTFKGTEMKADRTVKGMGMQDGDTLNCELFKIPITVKEKGGKTIKLDVEPCDTIATVKKMLKKETGMEVDKQCLKKDDEEREELKNDKETIGGYNIKAKSVLTLERIEDPIVFVDIKCGTLFGMDRDEVIAKEALTVGENKLDFKEATQDKLNREKILNCMMTSPRLGFNPQVVTIKTEIEDDGVAEAEKVKGVFGVSLKKRERNKPGEEFIFIDVKTGCCGELDRKKYIANKFITPKNDKELMETEKDIGKYDDYIASIRDVFGIKSAH